LALFLLLPAFPLHADSLGDAYKAYEKGQFEDAAKGFQAHAQRKPEDYNQLYNTGVALFQKGAHDEAISYFDRAMKSPDPALKSRSAYNKGVAYGQQQRWNEAEAAFQEALGYDNDNVMIQENLQFAREQKDRQKQEEPQQNQAKQDPKKNDSQEQDAKSEQKQAENQPGQPQNQQDQKKASEAQQSGEPQNQQNGSKQDQQTAEQKGQEKPSESKEQSGQGQPSQEQKQGSLAQKQDAESDPSQDGAAMQTGEAQAGQDPQGQRVLTIKELKKQEAEKLLRSVDDRIGSYILTPEQANTEGKSRNGKDW
jgi:Ca-activated chloride channel family protein